MTKTKRDLNADLAICGAATIGNWLREPSHDREIYSDGKCTSVIRAVGDDMTYLDMTDDDERFITEARTGWPHAIRRAMDAEAATKAWYNECIDESLRADTAIQRALNAEREVARLRRYSGFLRSVIRSGERLPDNYVIDAFETEVTADAARKEAED